MTKKIILCDDGKVEEVSEKAKKYGFGIEVQALHKPAFCKDQELINSHKNHIKGIQPISFHAPFADLCPWSSDHMVREVARNRFELWYEAAEKLGVSYMVFHIWWIPWAGMISRRADRCVNFRNEFLKWKSEKIQYTIENQFDHDPEMISLVIDWIHKDNIKSCLDIWHAHCYSKISVIDWIKTLKDRIRYVHIHDNNGENDEHLGIGKGNIPMFEVLTALNTYAPNAVWALECKIEDMDESIEQLKKNEFL